MIDFDHEPDHVSLAHDLLTDAQDSQTARDLLEIRVARLQTLEDIAWDLYQDIQLPNAYGKTLDRWGTRLGEPREGFGDEFYFRVLRSKALANNSDGTNEILLSVANLLVNPLTIRLFDLHPATIRLEWIVGVAHTSAQRSRMASVLSVAKPIGVSLQLVEGVPGAFGFSGGAALGFDIGVLSTRIL